MLVVFTPARLAKVTVVVALVTYALAVLSLVCPEDLCAAETRLPWTRILFFAVSIVSGGNPPTPENLWLDLARAGALLFGVLALGTVVLTLSERATCAWFGLRSRLLPRKSHAVIVGLGRVGLQLLRDVRVGGEGARRSGERRPVIVIEPGGHGSATGEARRLGALVLAGDARDSSLRRRARVHLAGEVFITCEDDALNMDVVGDVLRDFDEKIVTRSGPHLRERLRRDRHLQCFVHAGSPEFHELLHSNDVLRRQTPGVDVHVFNVHDNAARGLLLDPARGLARTCAPSDAEVAHYVIFGFGATAQTVAMHMARLAHFRNRKRLRLTVFGAFSEGDAEEGALHAFRDRHPGFSPGPGFDLEALIDARSQADDWGCRDFRPGAPSWRIEEPTAVEYAVNAEFVDLPGEVDAPDLVERLARRLRPPAGPPVRGGIVMCHDDDRRNFELALRLRGALAQLPDASAPARPVPLFAFLPNERGLASLLERAQSEARFPVFPFGQLESSSSYGQVVRPVTKALAGLIYHAYRTIEESRSETGGAARPTVELAQDVTLLDGTVDPTALHAEIPALFRTSNEDAAAHADVKLDTIGYRRRPARPGEVPPPVRPTPADVELLAQIEHNRWMAERLVAGWRYGDRDDRGKRRPAFKAWSELVDAHERAKDVSQIRALVSALNAIGQVVEPATPSRVLPPDED
jgi:hypothetical protein